MCEWVCGQERVWVVCARHAGTGFTKWSLLIHSILPVSDAYHSNILLLSFPFFLFLVETLSGSTLSFHLLIFGGADYQIC